MRSTLQAVLQLLAAAVLRRYRPTVVGVTGSVGKTSTKEAIATVLAARHRVRRNEKNYNNELGVPLTVLGSTSPGRSLLGWLVVLVRGVGLLLKRDTHYPQILVLEMGADHPGDLERLTHFVPLSVAVVTAIGAVHTEFFGTVENVAKEKGQLVRVLPRTGLAVLNADDDRVAALAPTTTATVRSYGYAAEAKVRASDLQLSTGGTSDIPSGMSMKVAVDGTVTPVFVPGIVGKHQTYAALAAIAVGLHFGMNLVEMAHALREYSSPAGRMKLLPGIKRTHLIDDTYNASPLSTIAALDTLAEFPTTGRRIAVLGDMAELGQYAAEGHQQVGEHVALLKLDYLLAVGAQGADIALAAVQAGMVEDHVTRFATSAEAGKFLQNLMEEEDLILIKGSQVVRMEKVVREVMAEPERAADLLVRQGAEWR